MMMREQQWDRSNCRHFRIDVCLHQRIYMRAFVNDRNKDTTEVQLVFFFCSGVSGFFGAQGSPSSGSLLNL